MNKKIALITGASTGIGEAIAKAFAKEGILVLLTARSTRKLQKVREEIEKDGGQAHTYMADLTDISHIVSILCEIKDNIRAGNYSQIDIIVNVAGVWHNKDTVFAGIDFEKFDEKVITDTYMVGFTAPTLLVHGLLPYMNKGGHIINISGTFENGAKGWLPYYASKKAIESLTYGLAQELKDKQIYVNGISPSDTATEEYRRWFPDDAKDAQDPKEVASLALQIVKSKRTGTIQVIKKQKYSEKDIRYVKEAIKISKNSFKRGAFPAGAILVQNTQIIAKNTSDKYPKIIFHAESKTIDRAINKLNAQLSNCTLYCSMEPCLMCLSRAYWSGIRKIVFAIKKESVPYQSCYESNHSNYELLEKFNEKIELVHIKELENEALRVVNK